MLRILLGVVLVGIIVVGGIVVYQNRDVWFEQTVKLKYYNGCVEEYRNKELISPSCNITVEKTTDWKLNFTPQLTP